jgi:hypothetical protein
MQKIYQYEYSRIYLAAELLIAFSCSQFLGTGVIEA